MSPRPRNASRAPMRSIGAKATTPSHESRAQASRNGGAAATARKAGTREVDWDAVIERFRADMAARYTDEAPSRDETNNPGVSQSVESDPPIAQRGAQTAKRGI